MTNASVIYGAYIGYVAVTAALFALRPPRQAVLIASMLGWIFLPVGVFPPEALGASGLTMEVIGITLPSRLLLTKALVVATTVFGCLVVKAPGLFARFRLTLPDIALGLFCLSPFLASAAGKITLEQGLAQAAYLTGVWGCTWMIGRLVLSGPEGRLSLAAAILVSGLCLLFPAVLEGVRPAWIYEAVYGPHPFASDGVARYVGYRPLAFFEHGNQYGMWISMAALVCVHGVLVRKMRSRGHIILAALMTVCAVASQSIGAILLLAGGCWCMLFSLRVQRAIMVTAALVAAVGGAAYVSGKVPLRTWAFETSSGKAVDKVLYLTNRGSLRWRVQRDQKALHLIHEAPLTGHGVWDWWRSERTHPWGLPLLIAGQFGLLALAFAAFALLAAPLREIWRGSGSVLPVIVILSAIDSWLNSGAYIPAILASAAIVAPLPKRTAKGEPEIEPVSSGLGDPEPVHG